MSRSPSRRFRLDVSVYIEGFLLGGDYLDIVQEVLRAYAPRWSEGIHIWRQRQEKIPLDVAVPGVLREAVRNRATERGPVFFELQRQLGKSNPSRVFGSAELRGADDTLILVVMLDEHIIRAVGPIKIWGNSLSFQINRSRVDGVDSIKWARTVIGELSKSLSPVYAHAELLDEYIEKNISREGGGTRAIGVDISRSLPGIYWLNYLGAKYVDFIGRERVLTTPVHEVHQVGNGVLLVLDDDPRKWNSETYRSVEETALSHLGRQFFFSKHFPDQATSAPNFEP